MCMRFLVLLVLASGCASAPKFAKRPFTAAEIRAGTPQGARWVYEVETADKPKIRQVAVVTRADETSASFSQTTYDASGAVLGAVQTSTSTWQELEGHATFPSASTTIEETTVKTPAGTFEAWLYTVTNDVKKSVERFWFAKEKPGAPVLFEQKNDGKLVLRVVLAEIELPQK